MRNLLFICSRNQWRSKTAEDLYKSNDEINVRSAGTSHSARIKINEKLIIWADVIFVMEKRHKELLKEKYKSAIAGKELIVLNIPDEYQYMDPDLISMLEVAIEPYIS